MKPNNSNALLILYWSVTLLKIEPTNPPDLMIPLIPSLFNWPEKVCAFSSIEDVYLLYFVWSFILFKAASKLSITNSAVSSPLTLLNFVPFKLELEIAVNWFNVFILSSSDTALEFK